MFGQKFTNTNEILQCTGLHCVDFVAVKLAQLNTALDYLLDRGLGMCVDMPTLQCDLPCSLQRSGLASDILQGNVYTMHHATSIFYLLIRSGIRV
jgi:hypothetical protein